MTSQYPIYKVDAPELDDDTSGLTKVSLVENPAMESNFVLFEKEMVKFVSDEAKSKVSGALLIPDKNIYREDSKGNGYYMQFSKEVIERLRDKFHKDNLGLSVNVDHSTDVEDVFLVESWIVGNPDKSTSLGLDLPEGTWAATYKVNNKEVLAQIEAGTFRGFSIEAFLDKTIKMENNKETKSGFMSSLKSLLGFAVIGGLLNEADSAAIIDNPNESDVNVPNEDPIKTLSEAVLTLEARLEGMMQVINQLTAEVDVLKNGSEVEEIPAEDATEDAAEGEMAKEEGEEEAPVEDEKLAEAVAENARLKEELAAIKGQELGKKVSMHKGEALSDAKVFANKLKNLK